MDAKLLSVLIFSCVIGFGMGSWCGDNEVFNTCGTACQSTCEDPYPLCMDMCTGGSCDCVRGYVRNEHWKCVPMEDCPNNIVCGVNESFTTCASACEPTCDDGPGPTICTADCAGAKCQCNWRHVRNADNVCVPESECP